MPMLFRIGPQAGCLTEMDYDFLLDKTSHLLSIGYNVSERKLDTSNYDLLASEARLAAFLGIAQGRIPDESWFALGRRRVQVETGAFVVERFDIRIPDAAPNHAHF